MHIAPDCTGGADCAKSMKVCVRRHRGVHRGTERVCAMMPEEQRRLEFLQFQKGQTWGLTR